MKLLCIILRKDRSVTYLNIDSNKENFTFNKGTYLINKEAVNISQQLDGKVDPTPELIYLEGDPIPLSMAEKGASGLFLDSIVVDRILATAAEPKSMVLELIVGYAKDPGKLMMLAVVVIIMVSFFKEQLLSFLGVGV